MFRKKTKRKDKAKSIDYAKNSNALTLLLIDYEIRTHLTKAQIKPARVLPRRDRLYLIEIASGALTNKQGQIFYNPSDRQLDKIFEGKLYGYC